MKIKREGQRGYFSRGTAFQQRPEGREEMSHVDNCRHIDALTGETVSVKALRWVWA